MEQTSLARIHNSLYWPDLTTYGPKMTREMYPTKGNRPLGCSISMKAVSLYTLTTELFKYVSNLNTCFYLS